MAEVAPGIEEMQQLEAAGFGPAEINEWQAQTTGQLQDAGFSSDEVDAYFGVKHLDTKPIEEGFKANLLAKRDANKPKEGAAPAGEMPIDPTKPHMKEADSFLEAIEAGFDMSVTGLLRERPDVTLPEHAPMFYRIASQVSQLAGDIPAMVTGAVGGAAAGTAVAGPVGTVVGGGAGAFALPEGMRTWMMQGYEKGEVQSFADFWERASATAINTLKAGAVGGATAGVGGLVAKGLGKVAAPALAKTAAQLTAEVTTMTTLGAALDGRVPEPQEFIDGAIIVGFMHGAVKSATKLRRMYAKGGIEPVIVAEQVQKSPKLKQEILSDNVELPGKGEFGITVGEMKPPENIPTVKPLREPNPNLSAEVNTILGKVGEKGDTPSKSMTTSQVYTALVDKLDPINQATKALVENVKDLPAEKNPYILARTAVDHQSKAKHFFEKGTLDFKGLEVKGESLRSILKEVESVETLEAFMISKRVLEKNAQGKQTGFDLEAAKKVVDQNKGKYEAAAKRVTEFSNRTLDYIAEAGLVSPEQVARMKEANKDYVPFKRIMDEAEGGGGKRQGKAGSLKEFKGSERDIQSPITSIVENTVELIKMAEINRPKMALVELAKQTEGQELIRPVKTPVQEIKVSKEDVARQLGISVEAAEAVSTFRAINKDLTSTQFAVMEQGKRKVYETTPELAEAINRLGGDQTATNMLFKIANGITTVKKIGITFTPDFILRNLFRDTLTASTFSKSKTPINPLEIVSAMGDIWKKNNTYYEWLKSGGANGAFLELGDRYVKTDIYKLQRETNFMNSVRNLVEKPIDAMRVAAELSEQSLRVAEFKKVRKSGGSLTEGGFASREITIDFQRVGAKMSALNSITAFMNVSIQGLDRTARAFKENPSAVATKSIAYITVPSVLLWWANHDDPRYQEIPQWEKDLFWIIPTDNWQEVEAGEADGLPEYMVKEKGGKVFVNKGSIYRLPKPQELGIVFGSLPERTLEKFFGENPGAYKNFNETMIGLVTPSFVPDAVAPAMEQYFNKSFFTGRDIVPNHLKGILPEYQFVDYTSDTAKTLGAMVATIDRHSDFASPMVLDNYIRSWGGSLGQYAVQTADKLLVKAGVQPDNVDPTATLSDIPFVKAFVVRFPQAGSRSVQDFYDNFEENKKVFDTIRYLSAQGDFESAEKELTLEANQDNLVQLDGIKEALSQQSKFIRLVNKNPEITADEKRQMIDGAYLMMTEIAKQGNLLMQEVKKELGE